MHKNLPIFQLDILGLDYQVFMDEEPGNIIVFHLDFEGDRIEFVPQVGEHVSVHDELIARIERRKEYIAESYLTQWPDDFDGFAVLEQEIDAFADALGNVVLEPTKLEFEDSLPF